MSPSIPRNLFADILRLIAELPSTTGHVNNMRRSVSRITSQTTREVCLNDRKLAANRVVARIRVKSSHMGSFACLTPHFVGAATARTAAARAKAPMPSPAVQRSAEPVVWVTLNLRRKGNLRQLR